MKQGVVGADTSGIPKAAPHSSGAELDFPGRFVPITRRLVRNVLDCMYIQYQYRPLIALTCVRVDMSCAKLAANVFSGPTSEAESWWTRSRSRSLAVSGENWRNVEPPANVN
jgi:hypothetical protein